MVSFAFSFIVFGALAAVSAFVPTSPLQQQYIPTFPVRQVFPTQNPQPYDFGYESMDKMGTKQHRQESSDATGTVKGSYGFVDPIGLYRRVEYIADVDGYRATVQSNEPGLTSNGAASAAFIVEVPPPAAVAQGLAYLTPQVNAKFSI
ncbi:uncharacterized protein NPIL_103391 [Nephila pilipes]|uniref:Cuticular protein n=1 Tax=Nephila pilipes TaxID=299642 RepID=A0A8X6MB70_NEPPI|nr:uncharacterized protein NPIL_557271 [Nephila pilipes]GFS69007.1 uncharacterized protein NPIL_212061 [Nephila pilipes]GFT11224.1 uncharacterized protein NPIL_539611 [Nephila pilipes]GFT28441.1 uncharacterized protein NPIL_103391 [Nephila pilipes]